MIEIIRPNGIPAVTMRIIIFPETKNHGTVQLLKRLIAKSSPELMWYILKTLEVLGVIKRPEKWDYIIGNKDMFYVSDSTYYHEDFSIITFRLPLIMTHSEEDGDYTDDTLTLEDPVRVEVGMADVDADKALFTDEVFLSAFEKALLSAPQFTYSNYTSAIKPNGIEIEDLEIED